MRKLLYIVALIIFIIIFPKPQTPYSGDYYAKGIDENLVLHPNNSFDINIISYKNSVTISGNYKIINNHIQLLPKDKNEAAYFDNISSGEITGSVITFKQSNTGSPSIFTKY